MNDEAEADSDTPHSRGLTPARVRQVAIVWLGLNVALALLVGWAWMTPLPGASSTWPQPTATAIIPQLATTVPTSAAPGATAGPMATPASGGARPTTTPVSNPPTPTPKPLPTATPAPPTPTTIPPTPTGTPTSQL